MRIAFIAGCELVDEAKRYADVEVRTVTSLNDPRAFEGCIDVAIPADPVDRRRVNNLEIWGVRRSPRCVARRGESTADRHRTRRHADARRFNAEDGGPLF